MFRPFTQYFVEAPLATITGLRLLGYDATSLAHLDLGSFSHSSLQILKLCQVGPGALLHIYFQVYPDMLDWVQVQALAGPLKDIKRLVPKPLLCGLGWVLRVVVLLDGEPMSQAEFLIALEQVFFNNLSVLCSVHLSLDPDSLSIPAAEKHHHSMMLPPPCFTVEMVQGFFQT